MKNSSKSNVLNACYSLRNNLEDVVEDLLELVNAADIMGNRTLSDKLLAISRSCQPSQAEEIVTVYMNEISANTLESANSIVALINTMSEKGK